MKIINSLIKTTNVNKAAAGITFILAISTLAIALIGLIAPSGDSFKAIVQMGATNHGILLGTSIVVLILDLLWMKALSKKKKLPNLVFQPPSLPKSASTEVRETPMLPESASTDITQISRIDQPKLKPDTFPKVLNILFLSYLDPETLDECSKVSGWKDLANNPLLWNFFDLRTLSPKLRVFDEGNWETHVDLSSFGLDVSDARPIDKRTLLPALSRLISSVPIEGDRGFTFLTIPKGLTLNKLIRLAGMPKQGRITNFRYVWPRISEEYGDVPVDHTYRIAISNNVLIGSRNKSDTSQIILVEGFGCQVPRVLEAITFIVTTHMYSAKYLYMDSPWTYTYTVCSEQIDEVRLRVGALLPNGLWVNRHYVIVKCGAACVRRDL